MINLQEMFEKLSFQFSTIYILIKFVPMMAIKMMLDWVGFFFFPADVVAVGKHLLLIIAFHGSRRQLISEPCYVIVRQQYTRQRWVKIPIKHIEKNDGVVS